MRSLLILVVWGIMTVCAAQASAADGTYLSVHIGTAVMEDSHVTDALTSAQTKVSFDKGHALTAAFGVRTEKIYRGEIEISTQKNDPDQAAVGAFRNITVDGDIACRALLANGYYDFVGESRFTPYISAGLGMAEVSVNDVTVRIPNPASTDALPLPDTVYNFDDEAITFAYQLGAGVGYTFGPHFTLDLKYRYFTTNKVKLIDGKMDFVTHNFYAGVRYGF